MINFDQISTRYDWTFKLNYLKQPTKHKFFDYLIQYWEKKSKNMDFVEDLRENANLDFLVKYDKKFNNKRKVEFESSLAGVIRHHPRMLQLQVSKVASTVAKHFMCSFSKAISCQEECHWIHQHFCNFFWENPDIMAEYTGVYRNTILPLTLPKKKEFLLWIDRKLNSLNPNDFHCQLLLIREYGNFFLRTFIHLPEFVKQNRETFLEKIDIGETSDKIQMKELWAKVIKKMNDNSPHTSRFSLKSKELTDACGIFDSTSKYNNFYINKYCKHVNLHLPGKNVWFVNSISEFNRRVRFYLDMPLIANQGGSIALLLIPAMISNSLNKEELRMFNLCAISYMVSNGHHSIHEFKSVWNALDIPYIDGCYKSLFPCGLIESHPELSELQRDFVDLM